LLFIYHYHRCLLQNISRAYVIMLLTCGIKIKFLLILLIKVYEYGHEQVRLREKRWNNEEMLLKKNMLTES
jgi:hypothetical protein